MQAPTEDSQEGAALALHVDHELAAAATHAPSPGLRLCRLGLRCYVDAVGAIATAGTAPQRGQRRHQLHAQQRRQTLQHAHIPAVIAMVSAAVCCQLIASKVQYQVHRRQHRFALA